MCADSPAPLSSMWTDGTENQITNFALDSGNYTEYYEVAVSAYR